MEYYDHHVTTTCQQTEVDRVLCVTAVRRCSCRRHSSPRRGNLVLLSATLSENKATRVTTDLEAIFCNILSGRELFGIT